ncbi:hypothetical protein J7K28_00350 [Candidatus Aerophobetes bacterium]|nr:hypothetical protein [Candidatus Aerophobetes bacterium]
MSLQRYLPEKGIRLWQSIYTYPKENYHYFTPVPRETDVWNELYAKRSACERSFKREKEDYKLNATRGEGKRCGPFV